MTGRRDLLFLAAITIVIPLALAGRSALPWTVAFPAEWAMPISRWIGEGLMAIVGIAGPSFRLLSAVLSWPMTGLQHVLAGLPAPAFTAMAGVIAWHAAGPRIAALAVGTFLYIWMAGYWSQSMNTLALVSLAILLAAIVGFALGVWAHRSRLVRAIIDPTLDLMQTIPTFAYLIPILLLFGLGPVVGLIASAIFASPPMVRNTLLGLERVPREVREAGLICGCSPGQQFWWVEVPAAKAQLKLGINQTTMAAFAMVIIAAIIGGFNDIGWEVLSSIRRADFGGSVLAGLVIALLAMSLDRITLGLAGEHQDHRAYRLSPRHLVIALAVAALLGWAVWAMMLEFSIEPAGRLKIIADGIDGGLDHVTANYAGILGAVKTSLLYFLVLPVKIGFERAVTPYGWGFAVTTPIICLYWSAIILITLGLARVASPVLAAFAFVTGAFLYTGTTGMPWAVFMAIVTACAYRYGGWPVAAFAILGQLFILLAGQWSQAMISVYLCATAVALSVALGMMLGMWGAASVRVSGLLRQVNDALQTVPQFVFLIPALMLFGVGDFTGLLAIMLYAIVPAIRYTEHGLRHVPADQIEAAIAMGCTRWQMLRQVRLPFAFPDVLLGINQTILFAMGMLVIASLVGTEGLGQQIYVGLGKNDPGLGIVAGLSLAIIGMLADRILRAASARRRAALGIT